MPVFWATSGYGARTRQPFVQLHYGDWSIQVSPEEARAIACSMIEAAEAAEQDGFLVEWAKQAIGVDDTAASRLLMDFRKWREAQRSRKATHERPHRP